MTLQPANDLQPTTSESEEFPALLPAKRKKPAAVIHTSNLVHMTLALLGLHIAYNSIQNIASSVEPDPTTASFSFAVMNSFYTVSSLLVGPYAVLFFGAKLCLLISAFTYVGFLAAHVWPMRETVLAAGAILGVGAGILWTAQGTYLTFAATNYALKKKTLVPSTLGTFNGIFYGLFQANLVVGNLITGIILTVGRNTIVPNNSSTPSSTTTSSPSSSHPSSSLASSSATSSPQTPVLAPKSTNADTQLSSSLFPPSSSPSSPPSDLPPNIPHETVLILMLTFVGIALISACSLCFLRKEKKPKGMKAGEEAGMLQKIFSAVILCKDTRILLLIGIMFYSGFQESFIFGNFNLELVTPSVGAHEIGWIMATFGLVDVITAWISGKIASTYGVGPVVLLGFLGQAAMLIPTIILHYYFYFADDSFLLTSPPGSSPGSSPSSPPSSPASALASSSAALISWLKTNGWYLYLVASLFSIGDAAWNTFPSYMMGYLFNEHCNGNEREGRRKKRRESSRKEGGDEEESASRVIVLPPLGEKEAKREQRVIEIQEEKKGEDDSEKNLPLRGDVDSDMEDSAESSRRSERESMSKSGEKGGEGVENKGENRIKEEEKKNGDEDKEQQGDKTKEEGEEKYKKETISYQERKRREEDVENCEVKKRRVKRTEEKHIRSGSEGGEEGEEEEDESSERGSRSSRSGSRSGRRNGGEEKKKSKHSTEAAYANYKFFRALGQIVPFLLVPVVPFSVKMIITLSILVVSILGILILHFFVQPILEIHKEGEEVVILGEVIEGVPEEDKKGDENKNPSNE